MLAPSGDRPLEPEVPLVPSQVLELGTGVHVALDCRLDSCQGLFHYTFHAKKENGSSDSSLVWRKGKKELERNNVESSLESGNKQEENVKGPESVSVKESSTSVIRQAEAVEARRSDRRLPSPVRKPAEAVEAEKKSELEASPIIWSVKTVRGRVQMLEHGHGAQENQVKESFIIRKQGDKGKTELESVRETILSKTGGKEIKPAVFSELERVSSRILNKGGEKVSQDSQRVRKNEEGTKVGNNLNNLASQDSHEVSHYKYQPLSAKKRKVGAEVMGSAKEEDGGRRV